MSSILKKSARKLFVIIPIVIFIIAVFLFSANKAHSAITVAQVSAVGSTSQVTAQTVTSFTPAANTLYLLWTIQTFGGTPATPTVTCANGLNMVQVNTVTFGTIATPTRRITLFRGLSTTAGTNNTCTITWNQTSTGGGYSLVSFTGVDTSGADGSGAVVQSVTGATDNAGTAGLSITLAALQAGSTTAGGFSNARNTANSLAPGTGYTAGTSWNFNTPATSARAEWNTAGSVTVNMTQSNAGTDIAGIAVEVRQPTPAVPTVTSPTVTSITTTGATLGANVTSLGFPEPITERGTCWGTSPSPATNCVAEGGTTTGVFAHARTGMSPSTFYYYRGYAINSTGTGYSTDGTFTTSATLATIIADGATPASVSVPPSSGIVDLDYFTLQTSTGTDTVTAATVTLAPAGAFNNIAQVDITNSSDVTVCTAVTPTSNTASFSTCNIPVTTSATTYKVRITPKTHSAMPAVPGASYATTGTVTAFTSTNAQTGTDDSSATITIDNLSPSNVPAASATAGDAQVSVGWTNPTDADVVTGGTVLVLRNTASITDIPTEGATYTVGGPVGASVAACVVQGTPPSTSCTDMGLTNGTPYYYKIFAQDNNGNYSATGFTPSNSPATPSVIIPPSFIITATASAGGTISPSGDTSVSQGNSQTYIITANSGYDINTLTVDGATTTPATSYTFTNVTTTHTISVTFIARAGVEATTAGPILASITFDGKAFPKGTVTVFHKELDTQVVDGQRDISNITGSFHLRFVDLPKGVHSFGLLVKDPEGRPSQTKFYLVDANATNPVFENIVTAPTIDVLSGQVTRGSNVKIIGYASPSHTVRLYLSDILINEMLAGNNGAYSFELPTGALDFGQYKLRAKQINLDNGVESDFSTSKTFIVSRLTTVRADFNGDGKVDIKDFSIFISRWGTKDLVLRKSIDLNDDGKVTIADFSIFIKSLRKN